MALRRMKALAIAVGGALAGGLVSASVEAIYEPIMPYIRKLSYPFCLVQDWRDTREAGINREFALEALEAIETYNSARNLESAPNEYARKLRLVVKTHNDYVEDSITRCGSRSFYHSDIEPYLKLFIYDPISRFESNAPNPGSPLDEEGYNGRCIRDELGLLSEEAIARWKNDLSYEDRISQQKREDTRNAEDAVFDPWEGSGLKSMRVENFESISKQRLNMIADLPEVCLIFKSIDTRGRASSNGAESG